MDSSNNKIGFIGYGSLSCPMGKRLHNLGYEIFYYTPSGKSNDSRAQSCPSPEALAKTCEIIIICVPNDKALRKSVYKKQGILAGIKENALLINMSTVSPKANKKLSKICKKQNIDFLEAPVSGSIPEAESGQLVCLIGGKEKTLTRARPILEAISKKICLIGPVGSASSIKLIINSVMAAGTAALAEGLSYGLAAGLDRSVLFDTLKEIAVISPHHKRKLAMAQEKNIESQFSTALMYKDLTLFVKECLDLEIPISSLAAVSQLYGWNKRATPKEDYAILLNSLPKSITKARS